MITADGRQVMVEGRTSDIMNDLANIIAAFIVDADIDDDRVLEAIKIGIKAGMEERDV